MTRAAGPTAARCLGCPRRKLYAERLQAWADAFKGVAYKLCLVSAKPEDMELGLQLGMGQRNGFVEHYLLHAPNPSLGQDLDADGYLVVNEEHPMIAENRASGDENEEYMSGHVERFGPIDTFPHRYREATLRMLQMRRNFVWAEFGPWLVNPPLLHYLALELGKNAKTAPDAWCYLRESVVKGGQEGRTVKNFERWLYQRDAEGARTLATNYRFLTNTAHTYSQSYNYVTVSHRVIQLGGAKPYDGLATINGANLVISNRVDGDTVSLSGTATLSGAGPGTVEIWNVAGLTLNNNSAGDYVLPTWPFGTVTITAPATGAPGTAIAITCAGNTATITFTNGTPGVRYATEKTESLTGVWTSFTTNTADANGSWTATDNEATNAAAFYRARNP